LSLKTLKAQVKQENMAAKKQGKANSASIDPGMQEIPGHA